MAKEENLFEEKAKEEGGKPAANTDKLKALRAAMDKIEKNYGKGSIMKLGDEKHRGYRGDTDRLYRFKRSAGRRRISERTYRRDLWSGIFR